ncbi:MAG: RNaseH domain-containing protein, partial [Burkholderiaceae bacterium]|nr:RNaseH domain-containing protein [Burkholderiaceae bacterium]
MSADSAKLVWTRSGTSKQEVVAVARRFRQDWLSQSVETAHVRFTGDLATALGDLLAAAKDKKGINLPIVRLRASLGVRLDGLIALERDLGLTPKAGNRPNWAVEMYPPSDSDAAVVQRVREVMKRWCLDVLQPWAKDHAFEELAGRVKSAVLPDNITVSPANRALLRSNGGPDFQIIAREIGERLAGETLFGEERGLCELVVNPESTSNTVELMTPPQASIDGKTVFSMVAQVTVVTVPYLSSPLLKVGVAKRVWAARVPGNKPNSPRNVTGYVFSPGRPITPVRIERTKDGWQFGEDYAPLQLESNGVLPAVLADAVKERTPGDAGWWVGLPELTTLFDYVSPRTVFEGDEFDLLEAVTKRLSNIVEESVEFTPHKIVRGQTKSDVKMLTLADVGLAGAALDTDAEEAEDDQLEDEVEQSTEEARAAELAKYREQNIRALRTVHADAVPTLWSFGGTPEEQELVRRSVSALFGDAIRVNTEVLPPQTHGLKADLPEAQSSSKARFEARLGAWKKAAEAVKGAPGPRFALICAPDKEGGKAEDVVNYYAGLHAMSAVGDANVHHVLPITSSDARDQKQHFIHRLQSALLDVLLAHSGIVFGVREFLTPLFGGSPPKATYGIQAVRSRARPFSGESDAYFFVVTRLLTDSGVTEVKFVYRRGGQVAKSEWLQLSAGLRWLATQRSMTDGTEPWLKDNFNQFVMEELGAIAKHDARALVLIDWDNVAGLWKGIRDEDLVAGAEPRLGTANLARAFPSMTLVRVRRGPSVLSFRVAKTAIYEALREDSKEATGERYVDQYVTTTKLLAELTKPATGARFGHFVASMGYSKTAQFKRGFSCYRSMPRMSPVKGGGRDGKKARLFEKMTLRPADMDAALPAPLDITVLNCPSDVAPASVAMVVMGLRLGYAHYNDWTALPAPLFFKRKIEDYIIRYSPFEDVAEEPETTVSAEPAEAAAASEPPLDVEAPDTPLSQAVVQEVLPEQPVAGSATEDQPFKLALAEPPSPVATQIAANPLDRAKSVEMPVLYDNADQKLTRLYEAMLQGDARVRVELPTFVTSETAFGEVEVSARQMRRLWDRMRDFGFVRKVGASMPNPSHLTEWLTKRLQTPQAGYSYHVLRLGGVFVLRPIRTIIERYNVTADEPLPLSPETFAELTDVAEWACDVDDDDAVAWLLFAAAQFPGWGSARNILNGIHSLPGPKSREACAYYLNCFEACTEAVNNKHLVGKNFPPILKKREPLSASAGVAELPRVATALEDVQPSTSPTTDYVASVDSAEDEAAKAFPFTLRPGSDSFESDLAEARSVLDELERQHQEILEGRRQEQEGKALVEAVKRRAEQALQRIEAQRPDICLPSVSIAHALSVETMAAELEVVEGALATVDLARQRSAEAESAPLRPGASLAEKRQAAERRTQALHELESALDELATAIRACSTFQLTEVANSAPASATTEVSSTAPVAPDDGTTPPANEAAVEPKPTAVAIPEQEALPPPVPAGERKFDTDAVAVEGGSRAEEADVDQAEQEDDVEETLVIKSDSETALVLPEGPTKTLLHLFERRRYSLAEVHVKALALRLNQHPAFEAHQSVLLALARTLSSLDCSFAIDPRLDADLEGFIARNGGAASPTCSQFYLATGVLAAGIVTLLFEGHERDSRWSVVGFLQGKFSGHPALEGLVEHVLDLHQTGFVLTREAVAASRVGASRALEAELKRMRERAKNWSSDSALYSAWPSRPLRQIHDEMFSSRYVIGKALADIHSGNFQQVRAAQSELKRKFDKPLQTLEEVARRFRAHLPDGKLRLWVIDNIAATATFVSKVLDLVERSEKPRAGLPHNLQEYLERLYAKTADARQELEAQVPEQPLEKLYVTSASRVLDGVQRLFDDQPPAACVPDDLQRLLVPLPMDRSLLPAMTPRGDSAAHAPLCTAEEVLACTRALADEALELDSRSVDDEDKGLHPVLREAARQHVESTRYLPAFLIERARPGMFGTGEQSLSAMHQRARTNLDAELYEARQRVAHAMALSALHTTEANKMLRLIEDIRTANNAPKASIGHPDCASALYPDFPYARAVLRRSVLDVLDARLTESSAKLQAQLDAFEATSGIEAARDIARVREMLAAQNASSLRGAYDAFRMLSSTGRLPPPQATQTNVAEDYESFVRSLKTDLRVNKNVLDVLLQKLKAPEEDGQAPWLASLTGAERAEAASIIELWLKVFVGGGNVEEPLQALCRTLGLASAPASKYDTTYRNARVGFYFQEPPFALDGEISFLPPELGSRAKHVDGVVLTSRPSVQEIRQAAADYEASPALILARTTLNLEDRAKASPRCKALLIDDDLIAYVALHPGNRVKRLLSIALLTYTTNPYQDYGEPVPREMFVGRDAELRKLRDVKSAAVLYGGRRLGKSSLLDKIEREERATKGKAAVYLSMDPVKFEANHVFASWKLLYTKLVQEGVISPSTSEPSKWQAISSWLEKEFQQSKSLHSCYLLLDEADELMGKELNAAPGSESFVAGLQQLCETVRNSFHLRYVIAGLHNVARMSTEANSPLGKAEPIALEPFSSPEDIQRGVELIVRPMAALGFYFDKGSEDLPLRILSVYNFYPAFIQMYCQALLMRLYNARQERKPPYFISSKDLDAVERDGELLSNLQTKFELNLNLDKRYKAIALILADAYYDQSDAGEVTGLATPDIKER